MIGAHKSPGLHGFIHGSKRFTTYNRSIIEQALPQTYCCLRPAITVHSKERDEQAPTDSGITPKSRGQPVFTHSSAAKYLDTLTEDPDYPYEDTPSGQRHSPNMNYGMRNLGLYTTPTIYSASDTSTRPLPETLTRATPDLMGNIGDEILSALLSIHRVSRRAPSMEYKATFELDWDPLSFVKEQQYVERADKTLERAITLTGSTNDAQALTTSEYLSQTWPATGKFVMQLVADVVRNAAGYRATSRLPDGTEVAVRIEGSKFLVTAVGTGDSLVEVGQQFAWLGAALRTSPFAKGVATCVPFVKNAYLEEIGSSARATGPVKISYAIGFKINEPAVGVERPPGLEMPLNMIASLAESERALEFNGRVFIKGFSAMLIAVRLVGDLLIWHYFFNSKGERISYLDHNLQDSQDISLLQLYGVRHVAAHLQFAGAADAQYNIDETGLPRPQPGAFLEKVTISCGKIITGGAVFAVGVKYLATSRPKWLRWMHTMYVVMWDEAEKRGWLVNGTSALLHLVRAALKDYSTSAFAPALLFDPAKMNDADEHMPESAVGVLIDPNNRELDIWPGKSEIFEEEIKEKANENDPEVSKSRKKKRGFTLFEDLVEEQYIILELIMEHHKHMAGRNGINLKLWARKHLEGWDFQELATGFDPRPRVATLQALGYGWVDFVRSIGAVTLLGCGFGHIIRPFEFDGMCPRWKELPPRKYYLAASGLDLNKIIKAFGSKGSELLEPVDGLLWHCPKPLLARCDCQGHQELTNHTTRHHDPVQVFYPKRSHIFTRPRRPEGLGNRGVVVFGHNVSWPYRWKESGNRDAEEVLEKGLPSTTRRPKASIAPQEADWEPVYSDADLSAISQSSRSYGRTDGTISRSLRSATTTLTTPDESVGRRTHDLSEGSGSTWRMRCGRLNGWNGRTSR
ncbi:MAG: hypothetical protein M1839_002879 [Geoglossum umbratile]|nr:MAG: hypothetical protein M1839_002879 [Geoglossum umbratile]